MFYKLGKLMVRLRWVIVGMWACSVILCLPLVPQLTRYLNPGGFSNPKLESQHALNVLAKDLGFTLSSLQIIYSSNTLLANSPEFIKEMNNSLVNEKRVPQISSIITPLQNPRQISKDGHRAYVSLLLNVNPDVAPKYLPVIKRNFIPPPHLQTIIAGGPVFYNDIQVVSEQDLRRAEFIAFPIALITLLIIFRSLVAAITPGVVGLCSVIIALGLLTLIGERTDLSIFVLNITTLLGLGLGVDYSLFMTSRFREELLRHESVEEAIAITVATAGRAVFFSGLTVTIGLSGLLLFSFVFIRSVGIAGVLVVTISLSCALTLLPALLSILGRRINALQVLPPWSGRGGFLHGLALRVMRYPVRTFVLALGLLLLLGVPFLNVHLSSPDASILPPSVPSREGFTLLSTAFDGPETTPVVLAVRSRGPMLSNENIAALYTLTHNLARDPRVRRVDSIVTIDPRFSLAQYQLLFAHPQLADPLVQGTLGALVKGNITLVSIVSKYPMLDLHTEGLVLDLRAIHPSGNLNVLVSGGTAGAIDLVDALYTDFPRAVVMIMFITYCILFFTFRSVILPLKAILMNLLSIIASYGALVYIFQEGHFNHLLNFVPLGFVEASTPILMFCTLFGLSMDYEVFLLTRVKEIYELTGDNTKSVAAGLERSGGIITSAASIVVLVSFSFVTADMILIKALGLGIGISVLLDASLVRALLVPATMRLLGSWNWWMPRWLTRLLPKQHVAVDYGD